MTNEELGIIIQTLIDAHNAALKASSCAALDQQSKEYIDVRLKSIVESCLMVLIGNLSAEQKLPYTDRKLAALARMESYLKGDTVAIKPTTPIPLKLLKTLIDDRLEIWESSSDPFLILRYCEVEKAYLRKQ